MRRICLALTLVVSLAASGDAQASPAEAEKLITTQSVTLRVKPGESAKAVKRLGPGANLTVLARRGRWIRVQLRKSKTKGWLTRTTVRRSVRSAKKKTGPGSWGKRSLKRSKGDRGSSTEGVDDALKVVVVADEAQAFARPSGSSRAVFSVRRDEELAVLGRAKRGRWLMVQDPDGRTGWVAATAVEDQAMQRTPKLGTASALDRRQRKGGWRSSSTATASSFASPELRRRKRARTAPESLVVPRRQPTLRATALFGYRSMASDYSSDGSAGLGNYLVSAGIATAGLAVEATRRAGAFWLQADAAYVYGLSSPGIRYQSQTSSADGEIAFSTHDLAAGLGVGATLSDGLGGTVLMARAGYVYSAFLTREIDNVGMMSSESLRAPTLGARLRFAPGSSWLVNLGGDLAIAGKRSQTTGLEDGSTKDLSALWLSAIVHRQLTTRLDLTLLYAYEGAVTHWSGPSTRQLDVSDADRRDSAHSVMLGLGTHL